MLAQGLADFVSLVVLVAAFVLALVMYAGAQMAGDVSSIDGVKWIIAMAVSAVMIVLYAVFVQWFEKHPARDIPRAKLVGDTAKGLAIGAGFMAAVVLVMMAFGLYRITGAGTDRPLAIISAFFLFLYVGVGEEILFRGVLFRWIDEKWGFVAALTVSALLFGAMHYGQPGATWWSSLAIAIEAGLLLGAAYKYSGTLWLPIGIHWAWNFVQGNVFGFQVSGGDAGKSLLQATVNGPDCLTGGAFGAEASIITVILGLGLSVWYLWRIHLKNARKTP